MRPLPRDETWDMIYPFGILVTPPGAEITVLSGGRAGIISSSVG